jgi:hypothetical protein
MLDKRQRRKFEQKAAKETKAHRGWVSAMVIRSGLRRLSGFPIVLLFRWCSQMQRLVRHGGESVSNFAAQLDRFDECSTKGSEENLNRRQQRKQRRIGDEFPRWLFGRAFDDSPVFQSSSMLKGCGPNAGARINVSASARLPRWPLGRVPLDMRHATALGDSAKTMRTIGEAPKALQDDHDRDPTP